ncbi:hypothetical protein BSL78_28141 [Apostichopus japonicus]|uniref:Uncharacterized protein n=1 Tax=Stichopus japonicus TaxID=307972 RepID=A0A2G8JH19_STIJA|nr:hypothetical protein BSL78_28141 [Apostichopus japonicus]
MSGIFGGYTDDHPKELIYTHLDILPPTDASLPTTTDETTGAGQTGSNDVILILTLVVTCLSVVIILISVLVLIFVCKIKTPTEDLNSLEKKLAETHHYHIDTSDERSANRSKLDPNQALPPVPEDTSYMELNVKTRQDEGPYYLAPNSNTFTKQTFWGGCKGRFFVLFLFLERNNGNSS